MSRRVWIIATSIAVHAGAGLGIFATSVWNIDRLDPGRADVSLAMPVAAPPPPAAGGAPSNAQVPVSKPKRIAKDLTQTPMKIVIAKLDTLPSSGGGTGDSGNGKGPGGGDGTCLVEPCGPIGTLPALELPPVPEVPKVDIPPPPVVNTRVTELRTAGETQIAPDYATKREMSNDGVSSVFVRFKVCVDVSGNATAQLVKPSKYAAYDAKLVEGINKWRYRPLMVNGKPAPTCGPVDFIFTMR